MTDPASGDQPDASADPSSDPAADRPTDPAADPPTDPAEELLKTGVVDLTELDALLAEGSPPKGTPTTPGGNLDRDPDSDRDDDRDRGADRDEGDASGDSEPSLAALARLELLGDELERSLDERRRAEAVATETPPVDPSGEVGQAPGMLRNNVIVAAGTALSRLTGLLRVAVFGYIIGGGALADAYLIGNETPNIVYELLIGGVLSATLVPLFTSFMQRDDDGGDDATNVVITITMTGLVFITIVAVLAAPAIFGLYTINNQDVDPALLHEVGTLLTRVFLLQILFYGMAGVLNAYLHSRRRFFAAAWSPVLSNVVIIATLLSLPREAWRLADVLSNDRLRLTLALGTTAGIATMALALLPAVLRAGLRFRPAFHFRHPAVKRLVTLSLWTFGYVVCNQVVLIVVRNLSGPGSGDATAYFLAFTFFVLPHGLLAMSIATTFVPELARAVGDRDRTAFCHRASLGIRIIALLTVPAGMAMFALRRPIIGLFLERGQYDAVRAFETSRALGGFAVGLVGFSIFLFALRGFYAHHDTRTPFILNAGECALNIVLAIVFVRWWGVFGLGLAFGVSYLIAALWALQVLSYKVRGFPLRAVLTSIWRMVIAGVLGGQAAWFVADQVGANTGADAVIRLVTGCSAGLAVYIAVLLLLRAPELAAVRRVLRRAA